MELQNGTLIVGSLTGTDSSQWTDRNGNTRHNHMIIVSDTYQDRYGNPQTNVTRIQYAEERLSSIQQFANKNAGERVAVPVRVDARTGRDGAFITHYIPNGAEPQVFESNV